MIRNKKLLHAIRMRKAQNQLGFSLMETLAVFVIIGLVMAAAALAIYNGKNAANVSVAQENLSYLRVNIHDVYSHVRSFASISNDELIAARAVPQGMLLNDTIVNAWNGDVTVASANAGRAFTIQFDDVPVDACIKLGAQRDSWDSLSINGTDIELEQVITQEVCSDNLSNTIIFTAH